MKGIRLHAIWALLLAAGCSSAGQQWLEGPNVDPLPAADDVQSIEALKLTGGSRVAFPIPREQWESVRAALLPAKVDNRPCSWKLLGHLQVTTRNGKSVYIQLFQTESGPGAFAAGPTLEDREYYRGGKTADVINVLNGDRK